MRWYIVIVRLGDGTLVESCGLNEKAALAYTQAQRVRGLRIVGWRVV